MRWLKKIVTSWVRDDWYASQPVECTPQVGARAIEVEGLSFNVMPATGGTIVQIRSYDRKTDRSNNITHVIPDGENIAERVGQIVSLEILRS